MTSLTLNALHEGYSSQLILPVGLSVSVYMLQLAIYIPAQALI